MFVQSDKIVKAHGGKLGDTASMLPFNEEHDEHD
jgi:hypothetical protein